MLLRFLKIRALCAVAGVCLLAARCGAWACETFTAIGMRMTARARTLDEGPAP